jgi:hypothetical protein
MSEQWINQKDLTENILHDQCTEGLKFSKHDLDTAILQHGELFYKVSERVAYYTSMRDEAKKRMEESYARNSLRIREQATEEGRKLTEDLVKQLTLLDEDYKEDSITYLHAKWETDVWTALKDSYTSRGFMIKEMAELWKANYFNTDVIKGGTEDVQNEVQRAKLAEGRKSFKDVLKRRS